MRCVARQPAARADRHTGSTADSPRGRRDRRDISPEWVSLPEPGVGRPLPPDFRRRMEGTLRTDFTAVRLHRGPEAAALGTVAFARGRHIHLAPGIGDPKKAEGRWILAHELAHVAQQAQRAGGHETPSRRGNDAHVLDHPALEAEADVLAEAALRGESRQVSPPGASAIGTSVAPAAVVQPMRKRKTQTSPRDINLDDDEKVASLKKKKLTDGSEESKIQVEEEDDFGDLEEDAFQFEDMLGSDDNPIKIVWYKQEEDYPSIKDAASNSFKRPTQGAKLLKDGEDVKGVEVRKLKVARNRFLRRNHQFQPEPRNGRSKQGKVSKSLRLIFDAQNSAGPLEVKQDVKNLFPQSSPNSNVFEIDHVHGLKLGGRDRIDNLWPLAAGLNKLANKTQFQKVTLGGEVKNVGQLMNAGKHFKVQDVRSVSDNFDEDLDPINVNNETLGTAENKIKIRWYKKEEDYPRITDVPTGNLKRPTQGARILPADVNVDEIEVPELKVDADNFLKVDDMFQGPPAGDLRTNQSKVGRSLLIAMRRNADLKVDKDDQRLFAKSLPEANAFEVDHVHGLKWGGRDAINNLWPLSGGLNVKANKTEAQKITYFGMATSVRQLIDGNHVFRIVDVKSIDAEFKENIDDLQV